MNDAAMYRIQLRGELGPAWSEWFATARITSGGDGTSTLTVQLPDQAALHGLLVQVRDLGLEIVAIEQLARVEQPR
jgi:hypothetical protein